MHANMVGVNQDNFFPSTKLPSIPCPVLSVFIAWLNVDLGIKTYLWIESMVMVIRKTCIYGCMQFVFPAYIWIVTAFIVVTSQLLVILSRFYRYGASAFLYQNPLPSPSHFCTTLMIYC